MYRLDISITWYLNWMNDIIIYCLVLQLQVYTG